LHDLACAIAVEPALIAGLRTQVPQDLVGPQHGKIRHLEGRVSGAVQDDGSRNESLQTQPHVLGISGLPRVGAAAPHVADERTVEPTDRAGAGPARGHAAPRTGGIDRARLAIIVRPPVPYRPRRIDVLAIRSIRVAGEGPERVPCATQRLLVAEVGGDRREGEPSCAAALALEWKGSNALRTREWLSRSSTVSHPSIHSCTRLPALRGSSSARRSSRSAAMT